MKCDDLEVAVLFLAVLFVSASPGTQGNHNTFCQYCGPLSQTPMSSLR